MFGSVAADRHSLLLALGVAMAAAYLAGGAAVANGLTDALTQEALEHEDGPRLAHHGADPYKGPEPTTAPEDAAHLHLALVHDQNDRPWVVAAIHRGTPDLAANARGLGAATGERTVTFPGDVTVEGRITSPVAPRGWVYVTPAELAHLAPEGVGHALLVPAGTPAPTGMRVTPLTGANGFLAEGAKGVTTGFVGLVVATSAVAVAITASLTAAALHAHRRDIHLYRSLGATRRDARHRVAAWLARVLLLGVTTGAAAGITLAYAVFSIGNRLGIRAPVTPAPDPVQLGAALAALGLAALAAGVASGGRVVRELEGVRLEVTA